MSTSIPIPRDSEAKLRHILRVSAQIFAEHGFEATSIRDISRATGVSLSGLYYYFEGKQHLLYLIQNAAFSYVVDHLMLRSQGMADPVERLHTLVLNHIEYFLSHPNEMKVLSHEEDALVEPYREKIQVIKRRYYSMAREIFDAIAAEGTAPSISPRVAVLSLFGMMNWPYKWHKPDVDPNAEELTTAIAGIFLHGVLPSSAEPRAVISGVGARNQD
ncbi:MAG TPA: TetR/AcrR family transcriptional regulator [Candidatus Eisenbacteria bacterium]|nr:TetR/AcrR family transcriptional regulator [Candidatus Eisenbacteria bacterium]